MKRCWSIGCCIAAALVAFPASHARACPEVVLPFAEHRSVSFVLAAPATLLLAAVEGAPVRIVAARGAIVRRAGRRQNVLRALQSRRACTIVRHGCR